MCKEKEHGGSGGGESKSLTNQKFDVRSSPNLRSGTLKPPPAKEQQVAAMSETRKKKLSASRDNRRAVTINTMKNAPKRRRGDPPNSCGKAGDPHDVEEGALAKVQAPLSKASRARLDARYVGAGGQTRRELAREQ